MAEKLPDQEPYGSNIKKSIILFTTGMTNHGSYLDVGRYDENTIGSNRRRADTGVNLYKYSNYALSIAEKIKKRNTEIYTVGLFHTMKYSVPLEKKYQVFSAIHQRFSNGSRPFLSCRRHR